MTLACRADGDRYLSNSGNPAAGARVPRFPRALLWKGDDFIHTDVPIIDIRNGAIA
jgi:uncharacterized protein with PIN domain